MKIAFDLGSDAHVEMLRRFGFGSPTGSGFPDESAGIHFEGVRATGSKERDFGGNLKHLRNEQAVCR